MFPGSYTLVASGRALAVTNRAPLTLTVGNGAATTRRRRTAARRVTVVIPTAIIVTGCVIVATTVVITRRRGSVVTSTVVASTIVTAVVVARRLTVVATLRASSRSLHAGHSGSARSTTDGDRQYTYGVLDGDGNTLERGVAQRADSLIGIGARRVLNVADSVISLSAL